MYKIRPSNSLFSAPKRHSPLPLILLMILILVILSVSVPNLLINTHPATETAGITVPSLPASLEGFRIVVLSDLHGLFFGPNQQFLLESITAQKFNVICVVGDICDRTGNPRALIRLLGRLPENTTVFFIPGDEDPNPLRSEPDASPDAREDYILQLEAAGAVYLDAPRSITVGKNTIWFSPESLFTLDLDSAEKAARNRLDELYAEPYSPTNEAWIRAAEYQIDRLKRIRDAQKVMTADDIQIALTHVPLSETSLRELHDAYKDGQSVYISSVSLVIAGHYNAGQWRLPGGSAVWIPESFRLRNTGFFPSDIGLTGLQTVLGVTQYISSGLGASRIYPGLMGQFRLFNQPRISVLTLTRRLSGI